MSAGWEHLWYGEDARRPALRPALAAASLGFGLGVRLRNALYDRGALPTERIEGARVISVGNLTVGGAGKTPVVIYLAGRLLDAGQKVAVLSRGYGRSDRTPRRVEPTSRPEQVGDEPLLIARRCPGASVWVGADRVEIARRARGEGAQVLLLDDGMQHRRLARDVDIAVVDGRAGFGNGRLLPRGPLREPPSSLARADLIWWHGGEEARAEPAWDRPTVRARHRAASVTSPEGTVRPLGELAGRAVWVLAGIARPERFRRSLEAAGARVAGESLFPDHHLFQPEELRAAAAAAGAAGAVVATTEKDAVRLPDGFERWTVRLEVEVVDGAQALEAVLGSSK